MRTLDSSHTDCPGCAAPARGAKPLSTSAAARGASQGRTRLARPKRQGGARLTRRTLAGKLALELWQQRQIVGLARLHGADVVPRERGAAVLVRLGRGRQAILVKVTPSPGASHRSIFPSLKRKWSRSRTTSCSAFHG